MITKRSIASLSAGERQLLRVQRLQSGQCGRCFHTTRQQRATYGSPAIEDSDNPETQNAPVQSKPRESRQQRAAKISNEVSMLQRGPPPGDPTTGPGSAAGTNQVDARPPTASAGFVETPQSMGGERMGENVSAGREGPNAQGVGRITGTDERVRNEQSGPQGTRTPHEVQEPAEGGLSVLEASTPAYLSSSRSGSPKTAWSKSQARGLQDTLARTKSLGITFEPKKVSVKQLFQHGYGPGVPAAGASSLIHDRIKFVTRPSQPSRSAPHEFVYKVSGANTKKLTQSGKRKVVQTLVAGRHDPMGVLKGEDKFKQAALNEIVRKTTMNGTYLRSDGERFLEKVTSLLPAVTAARTAKKAPQLNKAATSA